MQSHDRNWRVWRADGRISTSDRAPSPCNAGFRKIRISCDQTSRTQWLLRFDQPYSVTKGIFNPLASPREPKRPSVALWQIGAHREATFRRSHDSRSRTRPNCVLSQPIDVVQFYVPRMALEEFAYENSTASIDTLSWPHCEMDATLKHLGITVLSTIQRGKRAPQIFLDYIGQTILAHATYVYGGTLVSPSLIRGHLAPWQARRATEFLNANLYGDVSLASVAAECNISVSHFAHAFRRTFGRPPHRWLMERRMDAVKHLLLTSQITLAEIASECGFADQSALSRSFKRVLGESPGEWRRSRKGHH